MQGIHNDFKSYVEKRVDSASQKGVRNSYISYISILARKNYSLIIRKWRSSFSGAVLEVDLNCHVAI